jgi:ribose 5-phosphate isomerase B
MKSAIGCDHGGFRLRTVIERELETSRHAVLDCGAATRVPDDDYPDFTQLVGRTLQRGEAERGM